MGRLLSLTEIESVDRTLPLYLNHKVLAKQGKAEVQKWRDGPVNGYAVIVIRSALYLPLGNLGT